MVKYKWGKAFYFLWKPRYTRISDWYGSDIIKIWWLGFYVMRVKGASNG